MAEIIHWEGDEYHDETWTLDMSDGIEPTYEQLEEILSHFSDWEDILVDFEGDEDYYN